MLGCAVFTANRTRPSCEISTQHGAVCRSANGEAPIEVSVPADPSWNAETVPAPAPPWAFETYSWLGSVGRNSEPNGPTPCAAYGDPAAACRRPVGSTKKLSICEDATRVPTSLVPGALKRTSPGWALSGSATVEPGRGCRRPLKPSTNPV